MAEKSDDLKTREEKITQARELYCRGSRNYLVKCYSEAADEFSRVCELYEELYGPTADELGMPYLLYGKSLLSLALVENKVIDVPDEENDETDENEEDGGDEVEKPAPSPKVETNGDVKNSVSVEKDEDVEMEKEILNNVEEKVEEKMKAEDLTMNKKHKDETKEKEAKKDENKEDNVDTKESNKDKTSVQTTEGSKEGSEETLNEVQSPKSKKSDIDDKKSEDINKESNGKDEEIKKEKPQEETSSSASKEPTPGTSNGQTHEDADEDGDEDGENDSAPSLQLAWEALEMARKIFERQGESALANLAEVKTELGNIQFENCVLESARDDYNAALDIYKQLEPKHRRAMAEIHYKIGLTYIMPEQQSYKRAAEALKEACALLDDEIKELRIPAELKDKDILIIEDLEETRQEIWMKITDIEETQQQCLAEVRAGLDNYVHPSKDPEIAGSSSSVSPEKPVKDITHLIKRKKPENASDCGEGSPAKRPAL